MTYTKRKKIIIILFIVVALIFAAFYGWQAYRDSKPQSYIDFQQYAPTVLVNNLHISDKTVEVSASHPFFWFRPPNVAVRLRLDQEDGYIAEWKDAGNKIYSSCPANGMECFDKTTKGSQKYMLERAYAYRDPTATPLVYDKFSSERVDFVKGGTRITINLNPSNDTPTTDEDWSTLIDSFKLTIFNDLHVKHMHPGP